MSLGAYKGIFGGQKKISSQFFFNVSLGVFEEFFFIDPVKRQILSLILRSSHMQNSGPFAAYCYTHPNSGHQHFIKVMILMVFEWELIEMK